MYSILLLIFFLALPLMAQDASPEATATPAVTVIPATDATPSPEPAASPDATNSESTPAESMPTDAPTTNSDAALLAEPTPTPAPDAAPGEDIIPLPPEAGSAEAPMVSDSEVLPTDSAPPEPTFDDPNAVIPSDPSGAPAAAGPSSLEIARKLKIRYQEVRIQVEKDPAVRSLMEQSKSAKTFEDERAALREYYRLLFKKMKKVDKSLTGRCEKMETAYIERLAQTQVEPTIPLNPPPTPKPIAE